MSNPRIIAKDRDRPDAREFGDWSRKGPLPDLPSRGGNDRRASDRGFGSGRAYGDAGGSEFGGERKERRDPFPEGDGKVRDFGNWERKGPLSPLPQQERSTGPREGGRPRTNDGPKGDGFRDRRSSPAAWGEGRAQGSQDGSRPPRREFQERPVVERIPTAAEQDNQWRSKMRPDPPAAKSPVPSRDGSEAPSSPAIPAAAPISRPKLNLAKRTVSEVPDLPSPSSVSGDPKASPFGGARPIDTAAKEKEIEEKRLAAMREKKETEDRAREDKREAAKAAKAAEMDKQEDVETADGVKNVEILQRAEVEDASNSGEAIEKENQNGKIVGDRAVKAREIVREAKPNPAETGAWRRSSGGPRPPRNDVPRGPRGRGDGPPRGPRGDRPSRTNTNGGGASPATPTQSSSTVEPEAAALEEDGWSTVSKPKKNQRGGNNQASRAIAS